VAGREKFAVDLDGDASSFDAPSWDISGLKDRSTNKGTRRVYFTRYGTTDQVLPPLYADVVKSWIILDRHSAGNMARRLSAARILREAILLRRQGKSENFSWENLAEEDISQCEILMREKWNESTTYRQMVSLLVLTKFLAARRICRIFSYIPQTPRVEDFSRHTIAGQEARRDKLPSQAALNGLADIYREYATEPRDRLRAAALATLVVTGFRIGELLTLPVDCEVEEVRGGKPRYGLRYYKEKARGGAKMFAVRWLTPTGAELAQRAIAEIRTLTKGTRRRARRLEEIPHRVVIPGFHWGSRMTTDEVAHALGLRNWSSVYHIPAHRLPRHHCASGFYYRTFEVEAYLLSQRAKRLWTVGRRDGTHQMLLETLLIAPKKFFHPGRLAHPLLVEPVLIQQIADFLSGRAGAKSAFERFDIREPDGSFCEMTSHQFRHWLNYIADKGGLPIDLQTRWMGRENPRDTDAYRHATVDERLRWVKEGVRDGKLSGPKADMYFELARTCRDSYLDGEIQAVHATPLGLCLHDFAVTPCPCHLNCVRGCSDYLRTKGSQSERQHLIQIQRATERALSSAKAYSARGNEEITEPWVRHCEETLAGVKKALAVDDATGPMDGSLVPVLLGGPSRFKKLAD
jgi:hypothetical protein